MSGMTKSSDEKYSDDDTQRRLEAALRGARKVGHETMKDIFPKRPHCTMKIGKRKAKAGAEPEKRHQKEKPI
jgi:hypothetical protein